jgi:ligand-binding sensor domain-containing protein
MQFPIKMYYRLLICFINLFIFFSVTSFAQQFNIQTFTTKEGLSHNDVRAVAVDSSGFLWIATWDGLSRYDGYTFKNYFHKTDDSLSVPYFSILNIVVDGAGNLWLLTDSKLVVRYDLSNDKFSRIDRLYDSLPEFYSNISIDEAGYLWLINPDMLIKFNFRKNRFDKFDISDQTGNILKTLPNGVPSISTDNNDRIWLVYDNIYEFEKNSEEKLILKNKYIVDTRNNIRNFDFSYWYWYRIKLSESGEKWIFSNSGLYLLDESTGIFNEYTGIPSFNEFRGNGFLSWADRNNGIYVYDLKERKLSNLPGQYCQLVKGIFCQNKNLVWFANNSITGSALGLNRVVFTPDYFTHYNFAVQKNDVAAVYSITKDKFERLWVGMRGKNSLILIDSGKKASLIKIPSFGSIKDPGAVRSLNATSGGIWIGYFKDLLLFYDLYTEKFIRHLPGSGFYRPVTTNKQGNLFLWMPDSTISFYNTEQGKIENKYNYKPVAPVYKILIDENDILWAGLNQCALVRIDPKDKKSETFYLSNDSYNIEDICSGENGDLWLALLGGGVCQFNPETGKKVFYNTSMGLANNMTYSILKDKTGNMWVSTNSGISRINPITGIIRTFGVNEGLKINEFNSGASFKDNDNQFFMGGMGGLVSFFPDSINNELIETADQRIIINEIKVSGELIRFNRSVTIPDTVFLNKGENNIQVNFSSTDFINSDRTLYRYKLSDINDTWTETDSRNRNINYTNLKPGWYNLQLQATDRAGLWRQSKEIRIKINPFFYETLLFRIVVPSLILLLIGGLILVYIKQLKQKAEQEQNALRLHSLQGQMNPHFIFNSLNSINYFISKNDALSANRYIADFARLIRSILYNFNSDFISLEREIESLEEYLKIEYLRFGDKFNYKISSNLEIIRGQIKVSPGLVQPFVENAIWHGVRGLEGRKGNVAVTYSMENDKLTCIVEDDGIGRKKAGNLKNKIDQKISKGISIVTERLNIINKLQKSTYRIIISNPYPEKEETGTRVIIDIPIRKT